jgi:hypothetical protein
MVKELTTALNGKRIALMLGLMALLVASFAYAGAQNKVDAAAFLAVCTLTHADTQTALCGTTGTSMAIVVTAAAAAGNVQHWYNEAPTAAIGHSLVTFSNGAKNVTAAKWIVPVTTVYSTAGVATYGRTETVTNTGTRRFSVVKVGTDTGNNGGINTTGTITIHWQGAPTASLNEVADNYDYGNNDTDSNTATGASLTAIAATRSKMTVSTISSLGAATITVVNIEDAGTTVGGTGLGGSITYTLGSGIFALTGTSTYTALVVADSGDNVDRADADIAVTGLPTGVTPAKVALTAAFTGASGSITLTSSFNRIGAASSLVMKVISCGAACSTALDNTAVTVIPTLLGGVTGNSTLPTANAIYALSLKATDTAGNVVTGLVVNISDDDNGDGNDNDGATELYYGIDGALGGITITGTSATGNTNLTTGATYQSLFVITVAKAASATNAGTMTIKAKAGTLTASLDITVRGAAATYAITGPASVAPNGIGVYTITASDVNGNTPSVQAASAVTTPTYVVTNLGTSGQTVSTSATTVSVNPITGGTITIIAPSGGGSGTLAVITGGKIVASTEISYGAPAASTTSIALSAGWNLIRWSGSAKSVATAVNASVTSVYGWNATTQTWNMWSPAGVGIPGANDLSELASGGIYWVYSVTTGTLQ